MRLSSRAKRDYTLGEIVNLMAVDVQRLMDSVLYFNLVWTAPVQVSIAIYLIWIRLGPAVLAGLGVLILLNFITMLVVGYAKKLQVSTLHLRDIRTYQYGHRSVVNSPCDHLKFPDKNIYL